MPHITAQIEVADELIERKISIYQDNPPTVGWLTFGRCPACDLVLSGETISGLHGILSWSGGWRLRFLGRNGGCHNGQRSVDVPLLAREGDIIEVEGIQITLCQLDTPGEMPETTTYSQFQRVELVSQKEVLIQTRSGTRTLRIAPQQSALLSKLLARWSGATFSPLPLEEEELLYLDKRDPDYQTQSRDQARARLRRWWRKAQAEHTDLLGGAPPHIIKTLPSGAQVLTLDARTVVVKGRSLSPCT